jgi:transcriptional regulator with XRE-family HTH domain
MKLRLKLKELLEREGVSVYRISQEFERMGYTREGLYAIAQGKNRPSMESLETLYTALEAVLKREVGLGELLEQVRE